MCGIAGFIAATGAQQRAAVIKAMTDRLFSRGPDDEGSWADVDSGI
jgi:asparagine synthetase B (glutamine-hydrolysing)